MEGEGLSQDHPIAAAALDLCTTSVTPQLQTPDPALTCHVPKPQEFFLLLRSAGAKVFQQFWLLKAVAATKSMVLGFVV